MRQAVYGYLALSLNKLRDYNSHMTRWHSGREVVVGTFDRHDFSFKLSQGRGQARRRRARAAPARPDPDRGNPANRV